MNRRLLSLIAVAVMIAASLAIITGGESDAAASEPVVIHPVPGNAVPWVTNKPVPYHGDFDLYFLQQPNAEVDRYVNGEITLDELKTKCGYQDTQPSTAAYFEVHVYSNGDASVHYTYSKQFAALSTFGFYFADDPQDLVLDYLNGVITYEELESESISYTSDYYWASYSGGDSVTILEVVNYSTVNTNYVSLDGTYFYFNGTLYFEQNPEMELGRFVNKTITLDELKSKCGYTDSSSRDYNKLYFQVYFSAGTISCYFDSYVHIHPVALIPSPEACFTEDPYDEVCKYINGEMELSELKTKCGYTKPISRVAGNSYYLVSISGNNMGGDYGKLSNTLRLINVSPNYIFLDKGEYHIEIKNSDLTNITIESLNDSRYSGISVTNKSGSGDIKVTSQDAIWFTGYFEGGSSIDNTWREKSLTYTIDPPPASAEKKEDFDRTVKILSDREWVKMTTVSRLTGGFSCEGKYVMFVSGSSQEKAFLENVVAKGLMDPGEYANRAVNVISEKISVYQCRESNSYMPNSVWLTSMEKSENGYYDGKSYDCKTEKMSQSDVKPYKFYANYDFTIAVKYDTSKIKAVVMMYPSGFGGTSYSVMESGRVYDFHMLSSAEYELYAIPASSATGTLAPTEIGIYTENVANSDDNGMIFAGVAIAMCVLAFALLFFAGHRPKWGDMTGLPSEGAEVVQNDVPVDVPDQEIAEEASIQGPPKE